ncbi:MotA/TolQ/ExbB proton channel family protein [Abyssalbus ytuae]|uniref:MotA/TolQ/ExbB proton channel family protein n=1 Tax=Abyssalbus ytuae TaxID=2926907 RepID=A0A9E7D154_9FLAO|nr:MotA/TolQ/ExbB proton channel family protein [Abyssalbus ytuae]UOB16703.1 MotA/TolQ/ExbB proton channel family protein [Abyssalbus ytuae]
MFLFQDTVQEVATEVVPEDSSISIIELVFNGGTGSIIIIGFLLLLLFYALFIYFERVFAINAASKVDKGFMDQIKDNISNGKIEAAKELCHTSDSPVSRLIEKGISRIGKPLDDINKAIENAGTLEVYKLEKNVNVLATIAGAAPMIGFLGTVIGMVLAFHQMATAGGQAEMGMLASGIYTAMTTTVAGLIVGIVAYIGYNHLVTRTGKVVHNMEANVVEFLDLLNEPV